MRLESLLLELIEMPENIKSLAVDLVEAMKEGSEMSIDNLVKCVGGMSIGEMDRLARQKGYKIKIRFEDARKTPGAE